MIKNNLLKRLEEDERSLRWLSEKTSINYSTLYNFAHHKTGSISNDLIEKLCEFYSCEVGELIHIAPTLQQPFSFIDYDPNDPNTNPQTNVLKTNSQPPKKTPNN